MIYYMFMFYMFMIMMVMFILFMYFLMFKLVYYFEFELLKISSVKLELLILLDWISLLFISVVLFISIMVIFYSIEYMSEEKFIERFMYVVMLFVLSMMLMILSPNLISILIGWDGLGLVSYCLVIFYQNESSYNSGMVTVLTNRLGDVMILMLISMMLCLGSWNFMFLENMNNFMLLLLLSASITKSAQIPFSSWLPMAMAAPTPVSSLVHSSTLVTAGVYLLIRFNYLMMNSNLIKLIMILSILTMFLSGIGANFEFDLKKIIALSTLSQLGVMIFCLSMMLSEISFYHLLTHAMFKSMLFMSVGVIIHNMYGNQDIRFVSMVTYNMPMISMFFNCSTLSLCGIPFMSGFFSKDLILEFYLMNLLNKFIFMILFISMGLTVMYSIRLIYYSFIKYPQLIMYNEYKSYKSKMGKSMIMLFFMSIMVGLVLSWILFSSKNLIFLSLKLKLMIYFYMFIGMMMGLMLSKFFLFNNIMKYLNLLSNFFMMLWLMPLMYGFQIFKILSFSMKMIYMIDLGWNEYMMGTNLISFIKLMFYMDYYQYSKYFFLLIFISYIIFILFIY